MLVLGGLLKKDLNLGALPAASLGSVATAAAAGDDLEEDTLLYPLRSSDQGG